jgi:hypothetical protein
MGRDSILDWPGNYLELMRRASLLPWIVLSLLLAAAATLAKGKRSPRRMHSCVEACVARDQMRAITIEKIRADCQAECARPPEIPLAPRDAGSGP